MKKNENPQIEICIPMPLLLVIDDVGWWNGKDGSQNNEPYRTGIERQHNIDDYTAIIELGKKTGMRIQAGMCLCEWDRKNILRKIPTATWMGRLWNNTVSQDKLQEVSQLLTKNSDYIELCLHALGHEFWINGTMERAEWADENGNMRQESEIRAHLDAFKEIFRQNNLGEFPSSFIPAAFLHSFGEKSGIASILGEYGIKFISTPFRSMKKAEEVQTKLFGIDNGIPTVDRGINGIDWRTMNTELDKMPIPGPICGLHWPNILHPEPDKNSQVVEKWVKYLSHCNERFDTVLAKNTADCWTQLVYHSLADVSLNGNNITIDFTKLDELSPPFVDDCFRLKIGTDKVLNTDKSIIETHNKNRYTLRLCRKKSTKSLTFKI